MASETLPTLDGTTGTVDGDTFVLSENRWERARVASNVNVPALLDTFCVDVDPQVRWSTAGNRHLSERQKRLMVGDVEPKVVTRLLAAHPELPADVVRVASLHPELDGYLRRRVLRHPHCPPDVIQRLHR